MNTMIIHFNGAPHSVPEGTNLKQALAMLTTSAQQEEAPIATAVNGSHVARTLRGQTLLSPGDQITTFEPITGG